ncbi:MAG TPA: ComEC/Rec2 family competence protein, partial [Flavobacterium sp.]|nr:ComEC/Rec2 family competence protein [Flavobacterium sp.]
ATAGLVFVMPYITHLAGKEVEDLNTFQSLLLTALAAQIATSPLILYKFGTFSLLSLPVNVLVVPVVPFIMASTAAGALLGFIIPALGQITAWPAWLLASYVFKVTSTFSGLSFAQLSWQCPFILMLLSYVVLGYIIYRHFQRANLHIHSS